MRRIVMLFLIVTSVVFFFCSCARGITPYEAANGKAKCGKYIR